MAKRILVPILSSVSTDYSSAALSAARIARKSGGIVRLAYLSPLPRPRVDRHDRVVADTDREMARITAGALERLATLASEMEGVPIEVVVRFGRLSAELSIEAEVFEADLVALAAPRESRLRDRVRAWQLRRAALASKVPLILLPPLPAGADARPGGAVAVPALR
jgi:nucleotide-binding universal stress UspA family protein